MASDAVLKAAAARAASGASTKNTATGQNAAAVQAAAARVQSGASYKNTATGQPATVNVNNPTNKGSVGPGATTQGMTSNGTTLTGGTGKPPSRGSSSAVDGGVAGKEGVSPGTNPTAPAQPEIPQKLNTPEEVQNIAQPQPLPITKPTDRLAEDILKESPSTDRFYRTLDKDVAPKVKQAISNYEAMTGMKVFTGSQEFQRMMRDHSLDELNWEKIFKKFSLLPGSSKGNLPPGQPLPPEYDPKYTNPQVEAGKAGDSDPNTVYNYSDGNTEDLSKQKITESITTETSNDPLSLLGELLGGPPEIMGASLLKNALLLKLGAINDDTLTKYFDKMEGRALKAFADAISLGENSKDEVDKIISGLAVDPETASGLLEKIYKQESDLSIASNENDKSYIQGKYDLLIDDLQSKRADLEGYTKAKLYSMGAQDSSAGVTLLSKVLHEADLNITLANIERNHTMVQLNLEGIKLINDFANKSASIVQNIQQSETQALTDYQSRVDAIDKERITDEQEKRKSKVQAYSDFMTEYAKLQSESRTQQLKVLEMTMKNAQDVRDNALKLSGLMGTLYVPDPQGNLVDTGLPTWDANKFSMEQYNKKQETLQTFALKAWEVLGSGAAPTVEKIYGLVPGSLKGLTLDEQKNAVDRITQIGSYNIEVAKWNKDVSENNFLTGLLGVPATGTMMNPIDPTTLTPIQLDAYENQSIGNVQGPMQSGTVTVGPNTKTVTHPTGGSIDVVFKGGMGAGVHAFVGGEVVATATGKKKGDAAYGNMVKIKDANGAIHIYGHFSSVAVKPGDIVQAGQLLGGQGNTGNTRGATGIHLHYEVRENGKPVNAQSYFENYQSKVENMRNELENLPGAKETKDNWLLSTSLNMMDSLFLKKTMSTLLKGFSSALPPQVESQFADLPETPTIEFTDQQNQMFERYANGDTKVADMFKTPFQQAVFQTSYNTWLSQNPQFEDMLDGMSQIELNSYNAIGNLVNQSDVVTNYEKNTHTFFGNLAQAMKDPNGASDVTIVFSFMKTLDPTSVVMEGEQVRVINAGGLSADSGKIIQYFMSTGVLTPEMRESLYREAYKYYYFNSRPEYDRKMDTLGQDFDQMLPRYKGMFDKRKIPIIQAPAPKGIGGTSFTPINSADPFLGEPAFTF